MAVKKQQKQPEPRIAAGAAMLTGRGKVGEPASGAANLSQCMADAYTRAIEQGLSDLERSKAVDEAILKFQRGEPE